MLGRAQSGPTQAALNDALSLLQGLFAGAGYAPLAVPYLFPGDVLLDVYGEDLRARAFLFPDQGRGNELCLRPDFTVPVALAHGDGGWDRQATYAYQGPVFRNQPQGKGRPVEYLQAGIERFGDADPVAADAQVFALLHRGLAALGVGLPQATIGDLSIPFAALDALDMSDRRRAALKRHFWRPARFQDLIERACHPSPAPSSEGSGAEVLGLRSTEDVKDRLEALKVASEATPMARVDADLIGSVLRMRCPAVEAAAQLRVLTSEASVAGAADRMEARLDALAAQGIDPARLVFDADFGRNLEYYDGFVFEMRAPGGGDHPPLAGGGRYDALTLRLGAEAPVPAVGGIIRPEAVLRARA